MGDYKEASLWMRIAHFWCISGCILPLFGWSPTTVFTIFCQIFGENIMRCIERALYWTTKDTVVAHPWHMGVFYEFKVWLTFCLCFCRLPVICREFIICPKIYAHSYGFNDTWDILSDRPVVIFWIFQWKSFNWLYRTKPRVQPYNPEKTDGTVQWRKSSHSKESSTDIRLGFLLYIVITRSIPVLRLFVKFWKIFKHLRIYCASSVVIIFRKIIYSSVSE